MTFLSTIFFISSFEMEKPVPISVLTWVRIVSSTRRRFAAEASVTAFSFSSVMACSILALMSSALPFGTFHRLTMNSGTFVADLWNCYWGKGFYSYIDLGDVAEYDSISHFGVMQS